MRSQRIKVSIVPVLLLLFLTLVIAQAAFAGLPEDFSELDSQRKGPFSLNYLQGTRSRAVVDGGSPGGRFLFQAAYRNEVARGLVTNHGLYVANLFTTNYYELMGEYVYGDAFGSHEVDHQALLNNASLAMPKATEMLQHWILEKHYVSRHHNSKLAASFQIRGISGSEFETEYANYLFNFYLNGLGQVDEFQYLPAFLLLKNSPINASSKLDKARQLASESYDYFAARWGKNDPRVRDFYELRNAVHNQMSKAVVAQIDAFVAKHSFYKKEGHTYLFIIQDIVREYFDFRPQKIADLAKKLDLRNIEALALITEVGTTNDLKEFSIAMSDLKSNLSTTKDIAANKKADALLLIAYSAQYLAKELSEAEEIDGELLEAMVNTVYLEGFLIKDNWQYFVDEAKASGVAGGKNLMKDMMMISVDTINSVFGKKLEQWKSLSPDGGMDNFVDDVVKSSSLSVASQFESKL